MALGAEDFFPLGGIVAVAVVGVGVVEEDGEGGWGEKGRRRRRVGTFVVAGQLRRNNL